MKCFIDFQNVVSESNFEDEILLGGEIVIPHIFMRLSRILSEFKILKKWFDSKIVVAKNTTIEICDVGSTRA